MTDDSPMKGALEVPYREREKSVDIGSLPAPDMPIAGTELEPETELLTINIGPHHPATHGVLRLLCTLEGETVLDLEPIVGYVHTGIEKSCEDQEYWKVIPFVERMDYLSYYFNAIRLLQLGRDAAGRGGAAPRAVPARDPHGAEPDRQPPVLAGHRRAGPGRHVDAVVGAARARRPAGPVRDVLGPAHAHALLPGGRRDGGPPAGLGRASAARSWPAARAGSTSTRTCWTRTRSGCSAPSTPAWSARRTCWRWA